MWFGFCVELEAIWNMSVSVEAQYKAYADNTRRFSDLVTRLATTPIALGNKLQSLDLTNLWESLQTIFTDPHM
jgi:hypothetical protein